MSLLRASLRHDRVGELRHRAHRPAQAGRAGCNDSKGDLTPFQWLHGKEGWSAYVKRVEAHGTMLRNKKMQLLMREDAPELVERYTALAETAWISRLAQKIISLHFGWRNGIDAEGRKRVTVVSGGLTGRIRRKYQLNSLLNLPPAGTEDLAEWEAKADKNRDDDRHHALDAMVISFLPQWACDQNKEKFFRFPEEIHRNAKGYFAKEIAGVTPRPLARLRPALEETLYGQRQLNGARYVVKRRPLVDLATKEVKGKLQLKPYKDISPQKIVDGAIRKIVGAFLEANPNLTLEQWLAWCETARRGNDGPRIKQVLMTESKANEVDEYGNFSKAGEAGRGQFRRGASHAGYFVIKRAAPTKKDAQAYRLEVRPVFAFQSRAKVEEALRAEIGVEVVDYFFSNCQVSLEREWEFKGEKFPAGEYTLKTLWTQGNAVLKHAQRGMIGAKPKHNAPIPLRTLVEAGMRRGK
jgi:CRISPR-associated endonuclease Csn1